MRDSIVLGLGITFSVGLAACGGGGDGLGGGDAFVGTYMVTSHQRNTPNGTDSVPCTDFGPETTGEEVYIKVVVDDFFEDGNHLDLETCMTTPTDCFSAIVSLDAHDDHLEYENWNTQTGGGTDCALYATRNFGTLVGTSIRIESLEYYATSDDPDCGLDLAEALIGTPDCETTEMWEGTLQ